LGIQLRLRQTRSSDTGTTRVHVPQTSISSAHVPVPRPNRKAWQTGIIRPQDLPSAPYPAITLTSITPVSPMTMAPSTNGPANFRSLFNDALRAYKKRTREDLFLHPLAAEMQSCDSPRTVLSVLQEQARNEERWTNWLSPVVNVIDALSSSLGEDIGLVNYYYW
jgi:hypothetical protein